GLAVSATDAGPCGYFHHANLYARGGRAVEADLQGASPACITRKAKGTHCGCLRGGQRGHPEAEGAQCQITCSCWKAVSHRSSGPPLCDCRNSAPRRGSLCT